MKDDPGNGSGEVAPDEHAVQLTAWDVPSATVAGERFRFSVGVRCPAGCNLGGRELSIFDQDGARAGTVKLGRDICPGTEALYFAEVDATAPLTAGSHRWEAKVSGGDTELQHAPGSLPVVVRVVNPPDCEVTVRAVDRETQAPIQGARVVMHPYRAVTDEYGMARVRVARGPYDILVSGSRYLPVSTSVEVTTDMTTRAELDADQAWVSPDEVPE